jgi:hypothetical protein
MGPLSPLACERLPGVEESEIADKSKVDGRSLRLRDAASDFAGFFCFESVAASAGQL